MNKFQNTALTAALVAVAVTPAAASAATSASLGASTQDSSAVQPIDYGFFHLPNAGETQPLAGTDYTADAKTSDLVLAEDGSGDATVSVTLTVSEGEFELTHDALHILSVADGTAAGVSDSAVLRDGSGRNLGTLTDSTTVKAGESLRAQFHVPGNDAELDDAYSNVVVLHDAAGDPVASWDLH